MNDFGPHFEDVRASTLAFPSLVTGEAHLWAVWLNPGEQQLGHLASQLSADELLQANRYHFARDRRRFCVRRGFLRHLLGHYLACAPSAVRFVFGPQGKPLLANEPDLHFSLSHSADLALIGVSRDAQLGVDIENAREFEDADAIARRFFTPREVSAWVETPPGRRNTAFFNCWTRKEALVKVSGEGISLSLDRFEVVMAPDESTRVLAVDGDPDRARGWTLIHLEPAPGFIGAFAMRQPMIDVNAWILDLDRTALAARS
jgi:4'-phosphopantetheinyl transferase